MALNIGAGVTGTDGVPRAVPQYIAVEGIIGAGKTTLARLLAERLGGGLLLERFEENPFLPGFYRDPAGFAFQTQIFFLLSRYRQQQEISQLDLFASPLVSDYTFDKDRIFASLTLSDAEFQLYESLVGVLETHLVPPDLVIYLKSDPERAAGNIRSRGREMEEGISLGYLERLSDAYDGWFARYTASPILIVNTGQADLKNDPACLDALVALVRDPSAAGGEGASKNDPFSLFHWFRQ